MPLRSPNSGLMLLASLAGPPGRRRWSDRVFRSIRTFTLLLSAHVDYHWPVDRRGRGMLRRRSLRSLVVAIARACVGLAS
jgi:hypothetical protein